MHCMAPKVELSQQHHALTDQSMCNLDQDVAQLVAKRILLECAVQDVRCDVEPLQTRGKRPISRRTACQGSDSVASLMRFLNQNSLAAEMQGRRSGGHFHTFSWESVQWHTSHQVPGHSPN